MPASIPYNPTLVLGNIIEQGTLDVLLQISECQASIESAQSKLNSLIMLKRSIDMSVQELINMNVDTSELVKKSEEINRSIQEAAIHYSTIRLEQETKIQELKSNTKTMSAGPESPVDYTRTEILDSLPLSAPSIVMDVQYFSYNEKSDESTVASIKEFIDTSASSLGESVSNKMSTAAVKHINKQKDNHEIAGTLIITASCTHRNAVILEPLVLDVDKAIKVWNKLFTSHHIDVSDAQAVQQIADSRDDSNAAINILSGATYGSSFVGMVHILRKETTGLLPPDVVEKMQEQFTMGRWIARESGSFGVDPAFSQGIKKLLSRQDINAHVTLITMGVVPSIKSKEVRIGIKTFARSEGGRRAASNAKPGELNTVSSASASSQAIAETVQIQGASMESIISSLARIDEAANQVLDVNSMMTAFEDYITKVNTTESGVPVNFFVTSIGRHELANMWMDKYYPVTNAATDKETAKAGNANTAGTDER